MKRAWRRVMCAIAMAIAAEPMAWRVAMAQGGVQSSGSSAVALTTSQLREGIVRYRLVPEADPRRPGTTTWTVQRRFANRGGLATVVQVMKTTGGGGEIVDSLLFERRTLLPIWEHLHGAVEEALVYSGVHISGRAIGPDGSMHLVQLTSTMPAYSTTTDDIVVQSLPLARAYRVVLPFCIGTGIEIDTVQVRGTARVETSAGPREAWIVNLIEPAATETLWVGRGDRQILKHTYAFKRSGAHFDVITE